MITISLNDTYTDLFSRPVPEGTVILGTVRWNKLLGALAFDRRSGSYYLLTNQMQYTLPQIEAAQAHGRDAAYEKTLQLSDNPHTHGTLAHQAWDLGYRQSLEIEKDFKAALDEGDWNWDIGCRQSAITEIAHDADT